jgi:hypothetical protein
MRPKAVALLLLGSLAASSGALSPMDILAPYTTALAVHPLETKMITAGTLGLAGDALAQKQTPQPYDVKRALGFAVFGATYSGGFQHVLFPLLVDVCQGNGLCKTLSGPLASCALPLTGQAALFAAAERTLFNQLVCIPFLYYPLFFAISGFVQGLSPEAALQRAQDTWAKLVSRNLLFWLPVQFVQFAFVPLQWQVPYVCAAGLGWNIILSGMAGNVVRDKCDQDDECELPEFDIVCGMEGCVVLDEGEAEGEGEGEGTGPTGPASPPSVEKDAVPLAK